MDLVARKLNFVQEFLRISDEDIVNKLERLLMTERKNRINKDLKPMSIDQFNEMIKKSEDDIKNGRVTGTNELIGQIEKWK